MTTLAAPSALRRPLEALLGVPFTTGNWLEVLRNGVEVFPALERTIRAATRSVDLLWFQWGTGEVTERMTDVLAERAEAGVRVRMLLDGFGAKGIAEQQLRRLRAAGCEVVFFRPVPSWRPTTWNLRTHRRVLVCDETVAFTGGTGIDRAWTGDARDPSEWRDTGYLVRGPAVDGLRSAFAMDWLQTSYPVATPVDRFPGHADDGPTAVQVLAPTSHPGWNSSALALLTLIEQAQKRVRVTTPYIRLPQRFADACAAALHRGVEVQFLVPDGHVDRRWVAAQSADDCQHLHRIGVDVRQYQPTMLHAKVVTVDSAVALVGTTNADRRSIALNEQVALLVDDPAVVAELDAHFDEDLEHSLTLREAGLTTRLRTRAVDVLARPLQGWGLHGLTGPRP